MRKKKKKTNSKTIEWQRQTWSTDDWSYWVPPILHKPIVWWQNGKLPLCIHFPQAPFNPPPRPPPLLPRGRSINNAHTRPVEGREQGRREPPRPLPRAPNITARPSVITPTPPGVNATLWPARGWDRPGVWLLVHITHTSYIMRYVRFVVLSMSVWCMSDMVQMTEQLSYSEIKCSKICQDDRVR